MKKIDRAVEIIRGWSDEELKGLIIVGLCPQHVGLKRCPSCGEQCPCVDGWNEEVEE